MFQKTKSSLSVGSPYTAGDLQSRDLSIGNLPPQGAVEEGMGIILDNIVSGLAAERGPTYRDCEFLVRRLASRRSHRVLLRSITVPMPTKVRAPAEAAQIPSWSASDCNCGVSMQRRGSLLCLHSMILEQHAANAQGVPLV